MRFVSSNERIKGKDILAERFARGLLFSSIKIWKFRLLFPFGYSLSDWVSQGQYRSFIK